MIVVISATNRPGAKTRVVSRIVSRMLSENDVANRVLDLADLPGAMFAPEAYASKPPELTPFIQSILHAEGILTVVPEYNGAFPGVLKYFIDMLPFPESLTNKPAAFVGLSSGRWGGIRAVEQLRMVFHYRQAHLYGPSCFLPTIGALVDDGGLMTDPEADRRLRAVVLGFASFCTRLGSGSD